MIEGSPVQKTNIAQAAPDTLGELHRTRLSAVELAGLMEVAREPRFTDWQLVAAFPAGTSAPSCNPDILKFRLLRGTNGKVATSTSVAEGEDAESEQILTSVEYALRSRGPQRLWQFSQEVDHSLGSVGRKCSPQLLSCLPKKECIKFLEETGLLEPVIGTEPKEAATAGWEFVYASQIDSRPPMPSYEPFP